MSTLLVEVTQADIEAGRPHTVCYSPVGLALERALDGRYHFDVWPDGVASRRGEWLHLSRRAARAFRRFYRGQPIEPFRYRLTLGEPPA
jgi:hypothetical protein